MNDYKEITNIMVDNNVDTFNVIYRKLIFSFRKRVYNTDNVLITTVVNSMFFYNSAITKHWYKVLYSC